MNRIRNCYILPIYYSKEVGASLPKEMWDQLNNLEKRIELFADMEEH
jgi:hypothetical protein